MYLGLAWAVSMLFMAAFVQTSAECCFGGLKDSEGQQYPHSMRKQDVFAASSLADGQLWPI